MTELAAASSPFSAEQRARFLAVDRPIAEATGLPNEAYVSTAFAELERDQLLGRTWTCIGMGAQVPNPGDVKPVLLLGLPLILLRARDGELRVFHNVCSHRGHRLIGEAGNVGATITCPYHSWSYSLDGKLRATPMIGGTGQHSCPGFEKKLHGLKAIRSAQWFDCVFINLSGDAEPFEDYVAPLAARWGDFDPSVLRHGADHSSLTLELDCNWKLAVENYCEAYHLPWIHPGLNSYSRLEDHYGIEQENHFAGQGSTVYAPQLSDDGSALPHFPNLPAKWDRGAEYVALFPNLLLVLHADHLFAILLEPAGPERTIEHLELYYVGDAADSPDWAALRKRNLETWRQIFIEDVGVVEGMQRGRHSPAFKGGAFSPAMDNPTHCFHKWAARRLLKQ